MRNHKTLLKILIIFLSTLFKLKNTIDANIGIEYRYSKVLSAFINLNNITASKKYYWNFYPTQGFNILGGLTYSF